MHYMKSKKGAVKCNSWLERPTNEIKAYKYLHDRRQMTLVISPLNE